MTARLNAYDQPIGAPLPGWSPRPLPQHQPLPGRYCRLEPVDAARHADDLFAAYADSANTGDWTWLPIEPPALRPEFDAYLHTLQTFPERRYYAIVDLRTGKALGTTALMRMDPGNGSIEIGALAFSRAMRQSQLATESHFLLLSHVLDALGYRRCEWKCDSFNEPSRKAALRLGFRYEGTFRNAMVYKERNRDTEWYSIIDSEWPQVRERLARWLSPDNFDADGRQLKPLGAA